MQTWAVVVALVATVAAAGPGVAAPGGAQAPSLVDTPEWGSNAAQVWPGATAALGDWPMGGRGSYHEASNRDVSTLAPSTVSRLRAAWSAPASTTTEFSAAAVVGDALYSGGRTLTRRSTSTGRKIWSVSVGWGFPTTPAYWNGMVVAVADGPTPTLVAVDAATGAIRWTRALTQMSLSSPSIRGGRVFVGVGDRTVEAIRLSSGTLAWRWTAPSARFGFVSSPTTDGKTVYISWSGGEQVAALDEETGVLQWTRTLGSGSGQTLDGFATNLIGGRLFVGTVSSDVWALDASSGDVVWTQTLPQPVWRNLVSTQDVLVVPVGDRAAELRAYDPATGRLLWQADQGVADAAGFLALAGGVVFRAALDADGGSHLLGLDTATGAEVLRQSLAGRAGAALSVAGDAVYARTIDLTTQGTALEKFDLTSPLPQRSARPFAGVTVPGVAVTQGARGARAATSSPGVAAP
ncbi:MAG: PQQ-like beta-propeller repeat protein [Actinomycetota bacterium]|nr:PQQ-like beta-propeller repeat protein [Actinomycetota bacterium]